MPKKRSTQDFSVGYVGGYAGVASRLNSLAQVSIALILIICAIPLFIIIPLLIKLFDGAPVLYKGTRLGLNKTLFTMYKFRTLTPDAQTIIGAELLTEKMASKMASHKDVLKPFGRFLRETRLDELPQLFNILKGDMDFLGPRPERPEIYEKFCKHIKGYDGRFLVKPGLIGYSQLFTPHNSPKRIRSSIDNRLIMKKRIFFWDIYIIFITIFYVLLKVSQLGLRFLWQYLIRQKLLHRPENRIFDRVKTEASVRFFPKETGLNGTPYEAKLIDINEDAVFVYCNNKVGPEEFLMTMECQGRGGRKKVAVCFVRLYKSTPLEGNLFAWAHVLKYTPASPLNSYMVYQYFLHKSVIG
jgi:lipopolysaccharide/colanic/teichoic acid biosynthesis glycosyltransferase